MSMLIKEVSFNKVSKAPLKPCSFTTSHEILVNKVFKALFNLALAVSTKRILLNKVFREAGGLLS
jgi:hypothetical protein